MPRALGVIPARFSSTRFPGKPLAPLGNRTLLEVVWGAANRANRLDRLIVATDDERIAEEASRIGAESMMTAPRHPSGTDRAAEVIDKLDEEFDVVVNIQADEPLVTPTSIDGLLELYGDSEGPALATLSEPIRTVQELFDPNMVKMIVDRSGRALYFSRSPIPYYRGAQQTYGVDYRESLAAQDGRLQGFYKHPGVYTYTSTVLRELARMGPSRLEEYEGLEQLRALEAGYEIRVVESDFSSLPIDVPSDLERVSGLLTEAD